MPATLVQPSGDFWSSSSNSDIPPKGQLLEPAGVSLRNRANEAKEGIDFAQRPPVPHNGQSPGARRNSDPLFSNLLSANEGING